MAQSFKIQFVGWKRAAKAFSDGHLGTRRAVNKALNSIGEMVAKTARSYFPRGPPIGAWPPLAPTTIEDKRRKGYGRGGTLVRTGDLRKSIRHEMKKNYEVHVVSNVRSKAKGDKRGRHYAGYHSHLIGDIEYGGSKMPKRAFLQPARDLTQKKQINILRRELKKVPLLREKIIK